MWPGEEMYVVCGQVRRCMGCVARCGDVWGVWPGVEMYGVCGQVRRCMVCVAR